MKSLRIFASTIFILFSSVGVLVSFATLFPTECFYGERTLQEYCSVSFNGRYFWEGTGVLAVSVVLAIFAGMLWPSPPAKIGDNPIQAQ